LKDRITAYLLQLKALWAFRRTQDAYKVFREKHETLVEEAKEDV